MLSAEQALHRKTYHQALKGDKKAWSEVVRMIAVWEEHLAKLTPPRQGTVLLGDHDPTNAFEAMTLLGIAAYDDERGKHARDPAVRYLLLETWVVQSALERRSLRSLREDEISLVHAWSRDPRELEWPRKFTEQADGV